MEEERNPAVIEEFRKRKTRQFLVTLPLILAVVGMASTEDMEGDIGGIPVAVISSVCIGLVFAGVIFSALNWRCPSCKGYLGRSFSPKFCRKCGAQLQ